MAHRVPLHPYMASESAESPHLEFTVIKARDSGTGNNGI